MPKPKLPVDNEGKKDLNKDPKGNSSEGKSLSTEQSQSEEAKGTNVLKTNKRKKKGGKSGLLNKSSNNSDQKDPASLSDTKSESKGSVHVDSSELFHESTIKIDVPQLTHTSKHYSIIEGRNYIRDNIIAQNVINTNISDRSESKDRLIRPSSVNRLSSVKVRKAPVSLDVLDYYHTETEAKDRDTDYAFNSKEVEHYPIAPKIINKLFHFNLSGHLDLTSARAGIPNVKGLTVNTVWYSKNRNDNGTYKLLGEYNHKIYEYVLGDNSEAVTLGLGNVVNYVTNWNDFHSDFTGNGTKLTNQLRYLLKNPKDMPVDIRHIEVKYNDNNIPNPKFAGDEASIKFHNMILKLKQNVREWVYKDADLNNKDATRMAFFRDVFVDEAFIASSIIPLVDFATFLYIMADAINSAFDHVSTIGEKTGIIDTTTKRFINVNTTQRERWAVALKWINSEVLSWVPINTDIVKQWDIVKTAGYLNNGDVTSEDNPLLVPFFNLVGYFGVPGNLNDDKSKRYYDVKRFPAANNLMYEPIDVPIGNPLRQFLEMFSQTTEIRHSEEAGPYRKFFTYDENNLNESVESVHGHLNTNKMQHNLIISSARLTWFMGEFIHNMDRLPVIQWLRSFKESGRQFSRIFLEYKIHDGTSLELRSASTYDFKTVKAPNLKPSPLMLFALTENFKSLNNISDVPILDIGDNDHTSVLNEQNLMHHPNYLIFDMNDDSIKKKLWLKAFTVSKWNKEHPETSFVVNANLHSIYLQSGYILPYSTNRFYKFIPNVCTAAVGYQLSFDHGINFNLYESPWAFELTFEDPQVQLARNSSTLVPYVANVHQTRKSGLAWSSSYVVTRYLIQLNGRTKRRARECYIKNVWGLKDFHPNLLSNSHHLNMFMAEEFLLMPDTIRYQTSWTFAPFGDINRSFDVNTPATIDKSKVSLDQGKK